MNEIHLSPLDIIDLFFRFLAVGQLTGIIIYNLLNKKSTEQWLNPFIALGCCAYILLTAPIAAHQYGVLRGVFLFFTELLPYSLWLYTLTLLQKIPSPHQWYLTIKIFLCFLLTWFTYFFGYLQGEGIFHQINHFIALFVIVHTVYLLIIDFHDDLIDKRRKKRIVLMSYISFYTACILFFEIVVPSIKHHHFFSLLNALFILCSTTILAFILIKRTTQRLRPASIEKPKKHSIPLAYQQSYQALKQWLNNEGFIAHELTISELAAHLSTPEHQLRKLINSYLGFKNFSTFLNSYRIPYACTVLQDIKNIRKPILTLALDMGYGSVGSFNRAFKNSIGKTPKEYRSECHSKN